MRLRVSSSFIALCLALPAAGQEENTIAPDIGAAVARDFAQPAVGAFAEAAGGLSDAIENLCATPSEEALEDVRGGFAGTVTAWGRASVLRFGPLAAENRFERVFFWPDPRGVTLRQVQKHLASEEKTEDLSDYSVALQGLPALEYVLFGKGAGEALSVGQDARRCSYGAAIAGNLAEIGQELAEGWGEGTAFQASFTAPDSGSDPYRSVDEVAGEIVKAAGTALEFTRNAELLPALGEIPDEARGRRAPFWRSGLSFTLVSAQIDGVKGLVEAAGFTDERSEMVAGIGRSVVFDLDHAREPIEAIETAPEEAFEEEEDRSRLSYATVALEGAKHTINGSLAGALGLTMGFNALDGD